MFPEIFSTLSLHYYIHTVVLIRVQYFVLLNYSYKSWSIIKTRDNWVKQEFGSLFGLDFMGF